MKEKLLVGVMALALFVIMIAASVAAVKTEGPSASNGFRIRERSLSCICTRKIR